MLTEEELFGPRERRRRAPELREGAAVEALAQLAPGDLLVHAEHGIGVYRGLVMLEAGGVRSEMLRLGRVSRRCGPKGWNRHRLGMKIGATVCGCSTAK